MLWGVLLGVELGVARETRRGGDSEVISSEGSLTLLMLAGSIVARGSVEAGNHFSLFFAGR